MAQTDRNGASTTPPSPPPQFQEVLDAAFAAQAAAEAAAETAANTPVAAPTHAAASKATPVDADELPLIDSAASFGLKRLTWSNLKAALFFTDTQELIRNAIDATKRVRFSLTEITTATTRVLTIPDKNITIAGIDDINGGVQLGNKIQPLTAVITTNTLVSTLAPTTQDFRNTTLTSGAVTTITNSSLNITAATTASLGLTTAVLGRIAVLEVNNAGTPVLCYSNLAGGLQLDETNLISPTTIGAGSTSATVIYSASAVGTNLAYKVVGFIDATWTTGVGWAITRVQGAGGNAVSAFGSIGYGQTYQDLTASRATGTNYYNTTGRPIYISITTGSATATAVTITVNGVVAASSATNDSALGSPIGIGAIIPANAVYFATIVGGIGRWSELR